MEKSNSYVYIIFDYKGLPRYVGKGCGKRVKRNLKNDHNPLVKRIAQESLKELPIIIIRDKLTDKEACDLEVKLIQTIGRISSDGFLYNMTDGGEGYGRGPKSEEHRKAMSIGAMGKFFSKETRDKIAATLSGRVVPEETLKKISLALTGKCIDIKVTAFGETKLISEWSKEKNMPVSLIKKRMRLGWKAERAISEPRKFKPCKIKDANDNTPRKKSRKNPQKISFFKV